MIVQSLISLSIKLWAWWLEGCCEHWHLSLWLVHRMQHWWVWVWHHVTSSSLAAEFIITLPVLSLLFLVLDVCRCECTADCWTWQLATVSFPSVLVFKFEASACFSFSSIVDAHVLLHFVDSIALLLSVYILMSFFQGSVMNFHTLDMAFCCVYFILCFVR
jgi:hypothetical protein